MMYVVGQLYKTMFSMVLLNEKPDKDKWFVTVDVLKTGLNRIIPGETFLLVDCVADELEPRKCYLQILYKEKIWWLTVLYLGTPSIELFIQK